MIEGQQVDSEVSSLDAFPNEVFEDIFQYLSPVELSCLSRTCRSFYQLSTRSPIWEQTYLAFWREGDEGREVERGVERLREGRRLSELRKAARRAWLGAHHTGRREKIREKIREERLPFPLFLSSRQSESSTYSAPPSTSEQSNLQYYSLFLERIKIDEEVLSTIYAQCESSNGWLTRAEALINKYGNDAKDVLHALVACQSRKEDRDISKSGNALDLADWPTALQLRLPMTRPSRTHRLSLWHYGRELLEHLQRREAMQGLLSLRPDYSGLPSVQRWTDVVQSRDTTRYATEVDEEAKARNAKAFENGLAWLSMFLGGEGQEIAEELDVLAVSCALYLASKDISIVDRDAAQVAAGIVDFMKSRKFRGASPMNFRNLGNNFLHLCLDEAGRETLPMTIVVIFCSIAFRLGLSTHPTDTPARILAVVEGFSSTSSSQEERFWIDVFGDGLIMGHSDMEDMLWRMRLPMIATHYGPSTPANLCLRSARNIFNSVQDAHGVTRYPRTAAAANGEEVEYWTESQPDQSEGEPHAADAFERAVMAPHFPFNPRRTHISPMGPKLSLPLWPSLDRSKKSRLSHSHASMELDQQASMYAAATALTRIDGRLGERGSVWCASLLQGCFQLDSLAVKGEYLDSSLQSPLYEVDEAAREGLVPIFDSLIEKDKNGPSITDRSQLVQRDAIYPAGTLFVHREQGYNAVILSWNETCKASEHWILAMRVDNLPDRGRHQPFYHSAVADGSSRYVAHCNIVPAGLSTLQVDSSSSNSSPAPALMTPEEVEEVLRQRGIGLNFRCISLRGNRLRLAKNTRGQRAFPDDD